MRGPFGRRRRPPIGFFYAAVGIATASWFVTPLPEWLASAVVDAIPIEEDISLGAQGAAMADYRLAPADIQQRVKAIGRDILRAVASHHPQLVEAYDWRFHCTSQSFVNAFAYPGGRIYITRGLADSSTDDELAAVIGHEVGHVLHRHSQKRMVQHRLGAILLRALTGDGDGDGRSEGFGREVAGQLAAHASQLSKMAYSRSNEYEADHVGWYACALMGPSCQPDALARFFRKLDGGQGSTEWDSTHPGTHDRIQHLERMAADFDRTSRERGRVHAASHLAPPSLARGGPAKLVSRATSAVAAFWSALPSGVQTQMLIEGMWLAAEGLQQGWEVAEPWLASRTPSPTPSRPHGQQSTPCGDCEDCESKISFEAVQRGSYVRLGYGRCLSREDVRRIQLAGQLHSNPYTRQPFTANQRADIGELLAGRRVYY